MSLAKWQRVVMCRQFKKRTYTGISNNDFISHAVRAFLLATLSGK